MGYYEMPAEHWRKLRSTNPLERLNKEIARRSDVVGIYPNDQARSACGHGPDRAARGMADSAAGTSPSSMRRIPDQLEVDTTLTLEVAVAGWLGGHGLVAPGLPAATRRPTSFVAWSARYTTSRYLTARTQAGLAAGDTALRP